MIVFRMDPSPYGRYGFASVKPLNYVIQSNFATPLVIVQQPLASAQQQLQNCITLRREESAFEEEKEIGGFGIPNIMNADIQKPFVPYVVSIKIYIFQEYEMDNLSEHLQRPLNKLSEEILKNYEGSDSSYSQS